MLAEYMHAQLYNYGLEIITVLLLKGPNAGAILINSLLTGDGDQMVFECQFETVFLEGTHQQSAVQIMSRIGN